MFLVTVLTSSSLALCRAMTSTSAVPAQSTPLQYSSFSGYARYFSTVKALVLLRVQYTKKLLYIGISLFIYLEIISKKSSFLWVATAAITIEMTPQTFERVCTGYLAHEGVHEG